MRPHRDRFHIRPSTPQPPPWEVPAEEQAAARHRRESRQFYYHLAEAAAYLTFIALIIAGTIYAWSTR